MIPDIKITWHKLGMLQNVAIFGLVNFKAKGAIEECRELEKFLAGIGVTLKDKGSVTIELLGPASMGDK